MDPFKIIIEWVGLNVDGQRQKLFQFMHFLNLHSSQALLNSKIFLHIFHTSSSLKANSDGKADLIIRIKYRHSIGKKSLEAVGLISEIQDWKASLEKQS